MDDWLKIVLHHRRKRLGLCYDGFQFGNGIHAKNGMKESLSSERERKEHGNV